MIAAIAYLVGLLVGALGVWGYCLRAWSELNRANAMLAKELAAEMVAHAQTKADLRAAAAEFKQLSKGLYDILQERDY